MKWRLPVLAMIPFLCCFLGYIIPSFFVTSDVHMPAIVGMPLQRALAILNDDEINARVIDAKEDLSFEPGIVIHQMPESGASVRKRQTAFLTISSYQESVTLPSCIGLSSGEAMDALSRVGIKGRVYMVPSRYMSPGVCFAQYPRPGMSVSPRQINPVLYCAAPERKCALVPKFVDLDFQDVLTFLHENGLQPDVMWELEPRYTYNSQRLSKQIVLQQRPHAGSIIDLNHPPIIQLLVSKA